MLYIMTRLGKIHPYPAMIADHLAANIAAKYVSNNSRVLDPFCGTGRTLLAAAERGAYCVGVDINPLASLIVNAKASNINMDKLENISKNYHKISLSTASIADFDFEPNRKVSWFPYRAKKELAALIVWLNNSQLKNPEAFLIASILSATVREVSYCRKDQWKLHRMTHAVRAKFYRSPISIFKGRLKSVCDELRQSSPLKGVCHTILGDAKNLSSLLKNHNELSKFDLVITSPPYGDSKSTVQYGAMSGLSLGVLRYLKSNSFPEINGSKIDQACLGDKPLKNATDNLNIKKYWNGSIGNPSFNRVSSFLLGLESCCNQICKVTKPSGHIIFVVARRSTGGWRLYIDNFIADILQENNFILEDKIERMIDKKMTPFLINKTGRNGSKASDRIHTMRSEYLLVFKGKANNVNTG